MVAPQQTLKLMKTSKSPQPIAELPYIRYTQPPTPFFKALQKRVNAYFRDNNISRYGETRMYLKTLFLFSVWGLSYTLIMSNYFQGAALISLQVVFHFTMFLMSVGIAHDASHLAYSKSRAVNTWMNRVFDLVGITDTARFPFWAHTERAGTRCHFPGHPHFGSITMARARCKWQDRQFLRPTHTGHHC